MDPSQVLAINEIFYSIQGESTQAGLPSVFVRLQGCPLRCSWCDTEYAFHEGSKRTFDSILQEIGSYPCRLVEVTGGEPLAQPASIAFMELLVERGYQVMLETSGAFSIQNVPSAVKIIMDIKAPGSNEAGRNMWDNLESLKPGVDEIKFVVKDLSDFQYAVKVCSERALCGRFDVLVSPVHGILEPARLAEWIKDSGLRMRLQLQLHKYLWGPKTRGV